MLRRSARKSGQAPPEEAPVVSPPAAKRGRGGGRGRGRGRGKAAADPVEEAVEESNHDEAGQEMPESLNDTVESVEESARADAAAVEPVEEEKEPPLPVPVEQKEETSTTESEQRREEPLNDDDRKEATNSRNEERPRSAGRREDEMRKSDRPDWDERNDGGPRSFRRSGSREEQYEGGDYDDRRRSLRGGDRGGYRGPPPPYGGGHDGYGRGGYGGPPPPPWAYGRGRGRGDGGFRGGWRGGRGGYGGPPGPPHPGMMGPPPGHWDNGGYDQMGGPYDQHPPHMMPPHMRGPGGPGPMPPPHPYGPPGGYAGGHPQQQQQMMGPGPVPPMVPPPPAVPAGIPPLPPGPPPPPAPTAEMENVKTEEEMAAMKEQIARQIEQAREKALEEKEEKKEEKEEEKSEDKEKRKKQASAMFRAARLNKSTAAAAASSSKAAAAASTPTTSAAAAAASPAAPTTPSASSASSTPQPVPPPPPASALHTIASSIGSTAAAAAKTPTTKKPETRDVFGKDDEGGLFGERKATLSLPSAADRAEMQLYNDVLNAPHPSQDSLSPRKAPAAVPPPISTPAIVVSKSASDRRGDDHSKERRSRSPRSPDGRGGRERSPRRDRSRSHHHDSVSPARRGERSRSRSPRRSPKSSPRRDRRRSRSRSHGRHRSSRSRSKDRGGGGRTRNDSGHYSRRGASPARGDRSTRRRGYELSPVRSSGTRSSHRSSRRGGSKSPRRERSKSRDRKRSPSRSRISTRKREEEKEREERERRRSGGETREERRKKSERKDSTRSKENGEASGDEGKENSTPGHDEAEIDRLINKDTVEKRSTVVAPVPMETAAVGEQTRSPGDATVPTATVPAGQPRPESYEVITESIFHAEIKDRNDYCGECFCVDGECGVSCLLRYLTVECGRKCPSGDGCQNKAMQKTKGARVEVFHTGTEKGFGVRAMEPIKKGGFIIEYIGEVVTHKAGEKRKKIYARESPTRRHHYLMTVTDSKNRPFIIDATKYGNASRFLNHSCEPNAICDKWSVARRFRMGFFAKRNIEAGEEITFDYRFQNYGRTLIECACGAPSCRRFLASKDGAREEQERMKSGRDRSAESTSDEASDEDEEEEEEEDLEIKEEDRKKLRKQQSIMDEAERLLRKGTLTKRAQFELMSAIMIRLTPAHQRLRTRLVNLLTTSGEKHNEAYRVFLQGNGRTILQKYLSLGVDEDTTVAQYRELIPLMEALLDLLDGLKRYTDTTRESSVMGNLVPLLRAISAQTDVPDGLVVFEVLHDIVSGVEEEATEEDEEGEWTKRWQQCTVRAAQMAEMGRIAYSVIATFKIPKKKGERTEERREGDRTVKALPTPVSMNRQPSLSSQKAKIDAAAAGWQTNDKKDRRDSRDFSSFSKDRFTQDRGFRKRKYEEDSAPAERREGGSDFGGFRREEVKRKDKEEKKENQSATNSSDSPRYEDEDAMQISPNLDESTTTIGEPEPKRANWGDTSGPDFSPQSQAAYHYENYDAEYAHDQSSGPGWGGWEPQQGSGPAQGPAVPAEWYNRAYPNGVLPAVPSLSTTGVSYFLLNPQQGSSLTQEFDFWTKAWQYCKEKADDLQLRLEAASKLDAASQQQANLQHLQLTVAAEQPLLAAAAAASPVEAKPPRPPLNDRLAELTGVPIKKGGGGAKTPPLPGKDEKKVSPPAPARASDDQIAAAKSVRAKDGSLILISSIAKYCKVRNAGALYYYNKFTRSPTWELPEGEEANSEDELEVGIASGRQSASGVVVVSTVDSGAATTSTSRPSTAAGKTPGKGRPQTPPEEPADPISSREISEKEKLQRKSEFKTRSGELLKRYVKASMFNSVEEFKKTLRKIIHCCIEKEQKVYPNWDFSFSDALKGRMVEYVKKYVERHKLKPLSYPAGIAD